MVDAERSACDQDRVTGAKADKTVLAGAALLCALSLFLWWPGVALYDSVAQYLQVLSGHYDDWHPPVMARLWAGLARVWPGAAPMFLLQMLLYWSGFGLIAAALARRGAKRAAAAVLLVGAFPLFIAWEAAVLKDAQMLAAMLGASGIVVWHRLDARRMGRAATVLVALLLVYATLVRANAAFATVPLALGFLRWPGRSVVTTVVIALAAMAVAIVAGGSVGRMAADHSGVAKVQPLYDLVGIAHFGGAATIPGVTATEMASIEAGHCYTPFYWDPLGDAAHCGWLADRVLPADGGAGIFGAWARAVATHPIAYARHRLAHLNMSMRLWTPRGLPSAAPPVHSEPNQLGLPSPQPRARPAAIMAGWLAETPFGWPALWFVAGLALVWTAAGTMASPERELAVVLGVSALTLEASFAVVSIASDLRYHLWGMIAVALGWALLAGGGGMPRRRLAIGGAAVLLMVGIGVAARLSLPPVTGGYRAMLG